MVRTDWQGRWFAAVSVSPDAPGRPRRGWGTSVETGCRARLIGRLTVDAGLGFVEQPGEQHPYGSLGLNWGAGPVQLGLTLIAAKTLPSPVAGTRWVGSALWSF